jgi:hypothetical protein
MYKWTKTVWPFDPNAAKTIECHVAKIYHGKLFVWQDIGQDGWHFTISCGHNSERSMTGFAETSDLEQAKLIALARPEVKG